MPTVQIISNRMAATLRILVEIRGHVKMAIKNKEGPKGHASSKHSNPQITTMMNRLTTMALQMPTIPVEVGQINPMIRGKEGGHILNKIEDPDNKIKITMLTTINLPMPDKPWSREFCFFLKTIF